MVHLVLRGNGLRTVVAAGLVGSLGLGSAFADVPASAYVQAGLVAHYDAIANAGVKDGVDQHEDSPDKWVNLASGASDAALPASGCTVNAKSIVLTNARAEVTDLSCAQSAAPITLEGSVRFAGKPTSTTSTTFVSATGRGGLGYDIRTTQGLAYFVPSSASWGSQLLNYFWAGNFRYSDAGKSDTRHTLSLVSSVASGKTAYPKNNPTPVYFDGVQQMSYGEGWNSGTAAAAPDGTVYIGYNTAGYEINAVRIYDRRLSAAEIAANVNVDKIRFEDADPTALTWPEGVRWADGSVQYRAVVECQACLGGSGDANKVRIDEGTPEHSLTVWRAAAATGTLTPVPDADHVFAMWTGDTDGLSVGVDGSVELDGRIRRLFCVFMPKDALANARLWKGGGDTAAWSDGSNWVGGVAPGLGDIAVVPAGADATACNADYTYMNADATKLAGIRIETNAWMTVSNLNASVTHSVPLSGPGGWRHIKTKGDGNYSVTMNTDNSAFTGEFFVKAGGLGVSGSAKSLGTSNNKVTYYGNGGANRYFQYNVSSCSNEVHLYSNGGGYLYYGPNDRTTWGDTYVHGTSQTWGSGACVFVFNGGYFVDDNVTVNYQNGVKFLKNGVVSLGSGAILSSNGKYNTSGSYFGLFIGKPVTGAGTVRDNGGWIRFCDVANCLADTVTLYLNNASSRIDLDGGFDQQCGDLKLAETVAATSQIVAPSKAAKFTVRGTADRDVKALLNGKLSFALDSDKDPANPGVVTLVSPGHTMNGSLSVSRGTLTLGAESTFSNVTALVATGAGRLVVNTPEINSTATLTAESAANLVLNSDITVYSACVDDYYLPVETYDESDGYFTGSGHLTVLVKPVVVKEATYIGTDDDFANPENWEGGKLPDFEHGEVRVTLGKAGAPATLTIPSGIHVYGIVLKGEVATTLTGEKIFVGSGGVVCEKPAGSTATVANVLDLPFEAEVVPQAWTIPSGVSLQVKKPMSGAAIADYAISISGGGKLTLDADSPDLEPPLDLDNLDLYVNTSYALGSTNRFTKIKTPAGTHLHFGWGLKNYVPIDLSAYGTVNYFGDFGRGYEQAGAAKLNLMQNLCNGYTFSGGLVGSGQYYTIGIYSYTISGKPMAMPNGSIYNDATTLNLKSTGNVFSQITQVNATTKCQANNALCASGKFVIGRSNTGYTTGTLDLGGFDQDIGAIYNGATATAGNMAIYGTISSAKPATLTSHDATSRTVAMKFTGYAGYAHAGSGTYTFLNFANTATNTLSVLAGGVTLKSGAGFPNAKAVHVASGATLTVDKTSEEAAFGSAGASRALMTIEEGGTLALTDGAAVTVRRLCVGEKGMEPTVYTAGDPANPWLTGSGSVRVLQPWKPGILLIVK